MPNPLPTPTPPQPKAIPQPPVTPSVAPITPSKPPVAPTMPVKPPAPAPISVAAAQAPRPLAGPPPAANPILSHMPPSRMTAGATRPISPITQPAAPAVASAGLPVTPPTALPPAAAPVAPSSSLPPTQVPPSGGPLARVPSPLPPGSVPPKPVAAPQKFAAIQKSPLRFLPIVLGVLAIVALIAFIAIKVLGLGSSPANPSGDTSGSTGGIVPTQQTTLTYWGLWEPSTVMASVFADYEQANPGIHIEYQQEQPQDYRERLQTAISQGTGPDLFRFHASWTPMLRDELSAVPSSIYTPTSFAATFYPAAVDQLTLGGTIRGIPLMYDGLGLYYNSDILKTADAQPPKTWSDLRILAEKLTIRNGTTIQRAGLAIGNSTNVDNFSDILGLLMLQNGADLTNPSSDAAKQALIFYTDFVTKSQVWSDTLPNSTVAFARGDAAMMLAPSWRAHEVIAQNPSLNFGIAPVPELGSSQLAWASYWAEGVNSKSQHQAEAWKFLAYLSQADIMKKMYGDQAGVRRFGEIYSRKDLANELATEPLVAPYLSDAPIAKGWYMSSFTHDNGINDQIIKYYEDAVSAVLKGTTPETALLTVAQGVQQVLNQYGVPVTQSATTTQSVTPANSLTGL